jgi:hypothetical protein
MHTVVLQTTVGHYSSTTAQLQLAQIYACCDSQTIGGAQPLAGVVLAPVSH